METRELLKLISLLLQYPDEEIRSMDWQVELINIDKPELLTNLTVFGDYFQQTPLDKLQENYVQTFDFNDKTNLYLSYFKLGDEKERGQVLVELKQIYENAGLELNSTELPDYLPLFLEFISQSDEKISIDLLHRFRGAIEQTKQALAEEQSPYAELFNGLLLIIDNFILKGVAL